ncbi:MAG: hypothetical protein K0V04_41425 [Deltaproteobacteria bacterium]|nr:hypothetical protein [Deltaproteobacteria bacterium]
MPLHCAAVQQCAPHCGLQSSSVWHAIPSAAPYSDDVPLSDGSAAEPSPPPEVVVSVEVSSRPRVVEVVEWRDVAVDEDVSVSSEYCGFTLEQAVINVNHAAPHPTAWRARVGTVLALLPRTSNTNS